MEKGVNIKQAAVRKRIESLDAEEKKLVAMINRGQQMVSQAQFNLVGVRRARAELKQLLGVRKE